MPNDNYIAFRDGLTAIPAHMFDDRTRGPAPADHSRTIGQIYTAMDMAIREAGAATSDDSAGQNANWRGASPRAQPRTTGASKAGCGCGPGPKTPPPAGSRPNFLTEDQKAQIRQRIEELRGRRSS